MLHEITVRDVLEENNCVGKKIFYVTSIHDDETVQSIYRLNHGWLPPHMKLELASVAPMDHVQVVEQFHPENPVIAGDFVTNLSDTHLRDSLCRCGTQMVSDGFDVHCPNPQCGLTLKARFERLGNAEFFDFESVSMDHEFMNLNLRPIDYNNYCMPFNVITHGLFWGSPGGSLDNILLNQRIDPPSLATFLVPSLFEEFLENPNIPTHLGQLAVDNIKRFYGWMDEVTNRRDYYSIVQNRILSGFLWSLGIESLTPGLIEAFLEYETNTAIGDPMVIYAFLLTDQGELVGELGLHPVEASFIVNEVRRRKYEFHDIFYHYALNKGDITTSFNRLM